MAMEDIASRSVGISAGRVLSTRLSTLQISFCPARMRAGNVTLNSILMLLYRLAEASVNPARARYTPPATSARAGKGIVPQASPVYNRCTWLNFCCFKYGDAWCCREFCGRCRLL